MPQPGAQANLPEARHHPTHQVAHHHRSHQVARHHPPNQVTRHHPPNQVAHHQPPHQVAHHHPPRQVALHHPPCQVALHHPFVKKLVTTLWSYMATLDRQRFQPIKVMFYRNDENFSKNKYFVKLNGMISFYKIITDLFY